MGAEWWRGATLYQIYPRSFRDSDGDGVGDLRGVIEKLDYVASLGVDGVWLSPFFTSPMKDFGYDVSDYRGVDPVFGTLADFDALLVRARQLNLKVIIDQVWSHTSDQHPWFIESAASRDNPKSRWYVWAEAKADGAPPNNWQASFSGPSWTWNPKRRQYYLHNFLSQQPDLNFWEPAVQDAILDVARFWLDRGVDGFRLDVINYIFHDRELRDNPAAGLSHPAQATARFQRHIHDKSRPEALGFLARLRALVDAYPDRMLLGEVLDEAQLERQQEYTRPPDRLHTAYSFFLLYAPAATPALFAEALGAWVEAPGWPSWSLSNHDVDRVASRLARSGDPAQVRVLIAALLALRGTIFLYQGEELGLPQAKVPFERLRDPFAIAAYTGGSGRDGARTPMPWTEDGPSAGFSAAADTWLPLDPDHRAFAVSAQAVDAGSMLNFSRRLIAERASSRTLRLGEARAFEMTPGVLAIERWSGEDAWLCVFDLAGKGARLTIHPDSQLGPGLGAASMSAPGRLDLPAFGWAWLQRPPGVSSMPIEADLKVLAAHLWSLRKAADVLVVGLTGGVASGKTTLATALASALRALPQAPRVDFVGTDGFLFDNARLAREGLADRKGFPESYDRAALSEALSKVRSEATRFPGYSHAIYAHDPALDRHVDRPDVLIVEGLGLDGDVPLDCLLFLDASQADQQTWFVTRFLRLWEQGLADETSFYARFRGFDRPAAARLAAQVWDQINRPNLEKHIEPVRAAADIVIRKGPGHELASIVIGRRALALPRA